MASVNTDSDIVMFIVADDLPPFFIAESERAKKLFSMWGLVPPNIGIAGPENPLEMLESVPPSWTIKNGDPKDYFPLNEDVHFQEITLPGHVPMVH